MGDNGRVNLLGGHSFMAQFREIRNRLARFRRIQLTLQVVAAVLAEVCFVVYWLMLGGSIIFVIAVLSPVLALVGYLQTCRELRPEDDLHGTVKRLNAKKKLYRKRFGVRVRFSSKWFPFGEFGIRR